MTSNKPHLTLRKQQASRLYPHGTPRVRLESPKPIPESLEYRLAGRYWIQHGATPFSDGSVPYVVNNSGWAPRAAAELILAAGKASKGPFSIIEIGAGSGIFARQVLERRYGNNTKLEVVPAAVGTRSDTALLRRHKNFESNPEYLTISSSIVNRPNVDDQNSEQVRVINLIDHIEKFQGEISILKLDIEGSEVPILQSLLDSGLHQKVKFIFVETHERFSHEIAWQTAQLRARIKKYHLSHINLDHN